MHLFAIFHKQKGFVEREDIVESATIHVPHLPWVDPKNKYDCGVYVMRHMDTYMRENDSKWKHCLSSKMKNHLEYLRVKYCATITISECNELKGDILWSKKGILDLEKLLMVGVPQS